MALRVADRLLSEHHCVINQVLAVFLDEEHLSDKLTGRLGKPLLPDNRSRPRTFEDRDRFSAGEIAFLSLKSRM
jgi:hypothetical protein